MTQFPLLYEPIQPSRPFKNKRPPTPMTTYENIVVPMKKSLRAGDVASIHSMHPIIPQPAHHMLKDRKQTLCLAQLLIIPISSKTFHRE
ncbi:hypothetical protein X975_25589, partial [Stegodyphus mimosarum]